MSQHRLLPAVLLLSVSALCLAQGNEPPAFVNTSTPESAGPRPYYYEDSIRGFFEKHLISPQSVKNFKTSEPQLTSCQVGIYGKFYGWRVDANFHVTGVFGGLFKNQYFFWFHGNDLKGITDKAEYCPEAVEWMR